MLRLLSNSFILSCAGVAGMIGRLLQFCLPPSVSSSIPLPLQQSNKCLHCACTRKCFYGGVWFLCNSTSFLAFVSQQKANIKWNYSLCSVSWSYLVNWTVFKCLVTTWFVLRKLDVLFELCRISPQWSTSYIKQDDMYLGVTYQQTTKGVVS